MFAEIKRLFATLGLGEKEIVIMEVLLQNESLRVTELAKKARLNRTTAYGILKVLIGRGLVSSATKNGVSEFQSIDPGLLPSYVERQRALLEERKKEIEQAVSQMKKIRKEKGIFPQIYFFEGLEGLKQAYEDTLENNKGKIIEEFTGPDAMFDELGQEQWVRNYIAKRKRKNIHCKIIAPNTKWSRWTKENDADSLRITKLIPEEYSFASEIVLYDDKVGIFSFSKEKPVALLIEDVTIAKTMRTIFSYIDNNLSE